jgi:GNAT superfamily N-acetyltransferase
VARLPGRRPARPDARLHRHGGELLSELRIESLSPANLDDYFAFFEGPAFADNRAWSACYCSFYNLTGTNEELMARTAAENKAFKAELVHSGRTHGLLAYRGDHVAGWCHAAPTTTLPGLADDLPIDPSQGAVVCFVIAPEERRRGVATALLRAVDDHLEALGVREVTGLPLPEPRTEGRGPLPADALNYHGTLSMFKAAGYEAAGRAGHFVKVVKRL